MSFPPTACPADGLSLRDGAQQKSSLLLCGYISLVCRTARSFCCFVFLFVIPLFCCAGGGIYKRGTTFKSVFPFVLPFPTFKAKFNLRTFYILFFYFYYQPRLKFFSVKTYFLHLNLHSARGQFFKSDLIFSL